MTASSYETAWLIYLLAATGIILILWRLTRRWPLFLRHACRISSIALLLTPYVSDPEKQVFAPAFLISLFGLAFGDPEQALNAAKPLGVVLLVGMILSLAFSFTQQKKRP
jgi:hypothetical protein